MRQKIKKLGELAVKTLVAAMMLGLVSFSGAWSADKASSPTVPSAKPAPASAAPAKAAPAKPAPAKAAPAPTAKPVVMSSEGAQLEAGKTFRILKIQVGGNNLVSDKEIGSLVKNYEGKDLTLEDLKKLSLEIQQLYKNKSYFLARVYVPAQEIQNGTARLQVLEGKLGEVKVEGNRYYSTKFIKKYFAPVARDGAISYEDLQRSLLLLNEFSDLSVKSVLAAGTDPGSTDITLKVEDKKPFHVGLDYNNFGNPYVGENRAGLNLNWGNLAGQGDMLAVRSVFAFPSKTQTPFYQAAYVIPLCSRGTKLTLSYASADMKVGQELEILDIRGEANIYGISFGIPLQRTIAVSSDLNVGLTSKSSKNFIFRQNTSDDELRLLNVGYNRNWVGGRGRNILAFNISQGLGTMFGGMQNGDIRASRRNAGDSFTKFGLDLARIQQVGSRNFLILRGSAQMCGTPLAVGELFSLGGVDSVRGYAQSEYLGDNGYFVSAEFRVPITSFRSNPLQGALFVDQGNVSINNPGPGEKGSQSLFGGGIGLRYSIGNNTAFRVDWGFPFSPTTNSLRRNSVLYGQFSTRM